MQDLQTTPAFEGNEKQIAFMWKGMHGGMIFIRRSPDEDGTASYATFQFCDTNSFPWTGGRIHDWTPDYEKALFYADREIQRLEAEGWKKETGLKKDTITIMVPERKRVDPNDIHIGADYLVEDGEENKITTLKGFQGDQYLMETKEGREITTDTLYYCAVNDTNQ